MRRPQLPPLRSAVLFWTFFFLAAGGLLHAQDPIAGGLDPVFNPGVSGTVYCLAVQPDGKILLAGDFNSVAGQPRGSIARLNTDGTVESTATFNPGAGAGRVGQINSLVLQPDGKILLGGSFNSIDGQPRNGIARLNANGTLESTVTFNPGAGIGTESDFAVYSVALQPDGKILAGGFFDTFNGQPRPNLVRLNADGTLEPASTFNPGSGPESIVRAIVVQPDGKILIGGGFNSVDGQERNGIARLNANGSVDLSVPEFATNPESSVNNIVLQPDGRILVAGFLTEIIGGSGPADLIRLNADGSLEGPAGFNPVSIPEGNIESMALQTDGGIVIGGGFSSINFQERSGIARLEADGTLESTSIFFVRGAPGFGISSLALQADGGILVGGFFESIGGQPRSNLARLNNNPALQSLAVPSPDRVRWSRGGTSPQTTRVTFELSTTGGSLWTPLGAGTYITGNWELTGLTLPGSGLVRARAQTGGGAGNSSSGLVEAVTEFSFPEPAIVIEQPAGTPLDNGESRDFGSAQTGVSTSLAFTIRNDGDADLTGVSLTVSGPDAAIFTITSLPASAVSAGGGETGFAVRFAPASTGLKTATLLIASSDPDDSLFIIPLTGTGVPLPVVTFAAAASTRAENGGIISVPVQLSSPAGLNVTVPFTVSGTASGVDAAVSASPLVIPAGASSGSITVTLSDDNLFEGDETVILTLGTPVNATPGSISQYTLTIADNDAPPSVVFAAASSSANESAGPASISVTLSAPSGLEIRVPFTVSGTADSTDAAVSASPLIIPAGGAGGTITVTPNNDSVFEGDETLILTLGTPVNATTGTPSQHTLTIIDDETAPVVNFAAAASTAGEAVGTVDVALTLSGPSASPVSVPFTFSGTAGQGTDYTAPSSPLVIPAGAVSANLSLILQNDALDELDETVILSLGNPSGAMPGSIAQHTLTITDDDATPLVSLTADALEIAENSGLVTVTAQLSAPGALEVSVPFSLSGTASPGTDFTAPATGVLIIPAGETSAGITVSIIDDLLHETDETIIVTLLTPVNALPGAVMAQTLTIQDNDAPPAVNLTLSAPVLREDEGSVTAAITLTAPAGLPVTAVLAAGGTAVSGSDYAASALEVTIPPGALSAAVTLTGIDNNIAEADKTILLALGSLTNATEGAGTEAAVTLIDDDTAKNILSITVSPPVTEAPGGGGALVFTVELIRGADGPVSVRYLLSGTATREADYTGAGGTLNFGDAELIQTVTLNVLDDDIFEPIETVTVTLSEATGAAISGGAVSGTILDNEPVPVVTVADAGVVSDAGPEGGNATFSLRLSGPSATPVTVPWRFTAGSAQENVDFTGGSGVLVFPPGSTLRQVHSGIKTDSLTEGLETFFFEPGIPEGAVFPGTAGERFPFNQTLIPAVDPDAFFGQSCAMQENVLVIGAPLGNGGKGEVIVFERNPTGGLAAWSETARLTAPDGLAEDRFGGSVEVWGEWIVAGAIRRDVNAEDSGAAYVFRRNATGWSFAQRLDAADGLKNNYFGWAVSGHGSTLAVSARLHRTGSGPFGDEGAVYVYNLIDGVWTLLTKLTVPDSGVQSLGGSLSLYGDVLAAGAPDDDSGLEDSGAVYLFERNAGGPEAWGQVKKLQRAGGPQRFQNFGAAVSLWEKTLAVGSASGTGVQVFERDGGGAGAWGHTADLTWGGAAPAGGFGSVLRLSGDLLAAGAPFASGSAGERQGTAYLFRRDSSGGWSELRQLQDPSAAANNAFGAGLAAWGGELAVCSTAQGNGEAHLFRDLWGAAFIADGPSPFPVSPEIGPSGEIILSWDPQPGAVRYLVQSSSDLWEWRNEADVLPPAVSWTAPATGGARIFYRITARF